MIKNLPEHWKIVGVPSEKKLIHDFSLDDVRGGGRQLLIHIDGHKEHITTRPVNHTIYEVLKNLIYRGRINSVPYNIGFIMLDQFGVESISSFTSYKILRTGKAAKYIKSEISALPKLRERHLREFEGSLILTKETHTYGEIRFILKSHRLHAKERFRSPYRPKSPKNKTLKNGNDRAFRATLYNVRLTNKYDVIRAVLNKHKFPFSWLCSYKSLHGNVCEDISFCSIFPPTIPWLSTQHHYIFAIQRK